MKTKTILLSCFALAAMASCSNQNELEGLQNNQNCSQVRINANYIAKMGSRATATGDIDGVTALQGTSFALWGDFIGTSDQVTSLAFEGKKVSYASSEWTIADGPYYWARGEKYDFSAVVPFDADVTVSGTGADRTFSIKNIPVVQAVADDAVDFLVSRNAELTVGTASQIELTFQHILSRLAVYIYTDANSSKVHLDKLNIYLPQGTATYTQALHQGPSAEDDSWSWSASSDWESISYDASNLTADKYYTIPSSKSLDNYLSQSIWDTPLTDIDYTAAKEVAGWLNSADPVDLAAAKEASTQLGNEYYIAPTVVKAANATRDNLQLYMDIQYTVFSKTGESYTYYTQKSYEAVAIQNLHAFTQGVKHNLIICVRPGDEGGAINNFSISVNDFKEDINSQDENIVVDQDGNQHQD